MASAEPGRGRPVTLVAEDDAALREEIAELLRRDGHEVLEASDGARTLRLLRGVSPIDLVVLDLWMPGMDGWTFRAEQKADPGLRDIPVVVLTADDSGMARAIDADAVLHKPFDPAVLCDTARRVLAEHRLEDKETAELLTGAVSLLVGAVSHEVANPLMNLVGALERTRGRTPALGNWEECEQMLEQCWRIAGTLRTLRELPYPEWTGEHVVDLAQLLRAAVARTGTEDVSITVDAIPTAMVVADPLAALYLCTTLVRNATEGVPQDGQAVASPSRPDVEVRLQAGTADFILEVSSRGAPIAEEDLARTFTAGYAGAERAWSMGLRLWFARRAVASMRGSISLLDYSEGRSTWQVRLPRARAAEPRHGRPAPPIRSDNHGSNQAAHR